MFDGFLDQLSKWGPWWCAFGMLLFEALKYGLATKRDFRILDPEDGLVHSEYARIGGIGAPRRRSILVFHFTNRWFLQEDEAHILERDQWIHEKCHFDNSAIGVDRTVLAIAVKSKSVKRIEEAFGGPQARNSVKVNNLKDLLAVIEKADGRRTRFAEARIRRV